ncbi:MAG: hypothetical protein NTZ67_02850 [Gammaproteobacteria bacterium]|nr:hypothetical protein [Gammaproteobacteria bacterium]
MKFQSSEIDNEMLAALAAYYRQLPLDASARQYCLSYCRSQLNQATNPASVKQSLPPIPSILQIVNALSFLTVYSEGRLFSCFLGSANNLLFAMDQALAFTSKKIIDAGLSFSKKQFKISLCLLFNETLTKPDLIHLGLHGLSISQNDKIAFFKNSVPMNKNYNLKKTLEKLSEKSGLSKTAYLEDDVEVRAYDALEFAEDNQNQLCDLYRGNTLILQSEIDKSNLKKVFLSSVNYIAKSILPSGEMTYLVHSATGKTETEKTLSAITRVIGSIWQLLVASHDYQLTSNMVQAKRALEFIVLNYFVDGQGVSISGKTHLGVNSLLLMAILAVNEDDYLKNEQMTLITCIEKQISVDKQCFLVSGDEALLYPAEAMLALLMLFEKSNNLYYLELCESLFPYYQSLFLMTNNKMMMSHWLSKCCEKLFFEKKKESYAKFIFEINDLILPYQIPAGFADVDLTGSFSVSGDCRSTATLAESLLAAYSVAVYVNDTARMKSYGKSVLMAIRFLLQIQVTERNFQHNIAVGGFRNSVYDNTIRIDNVQHVLCVLNLSRQLIF